MTIEELKYLVGIVKKPWYASYVDKYPVLKKIADWFK